MSTYDHNTYDTRSGSVPGDGTAAQRDDLYRLLVQHVKDYAIFLLDSQGYVRSWNEGAQRIKGYQAHEIIGQHFSRFYPPEEVQRGTPAHGLRVAAAEGRWEQEGWRVRKDGSLFWADVVITALYAEDGALIGFAKVTRDLTERKQAEEERLRLVEQEQQARAAAAVAEARVRMQEEFLAIAAHELKTPLTGAKIAAQLLRRRAAKRGAADDGPQQQALHTIDQQLARLGRLVEQLLETTRLQTGRLTLRHAPTNVTALVGTAVQAAQARAEQAEQQEVVFSAPEDLWASVDADRLEQVITNLLDNALKFSAPGQRVEVELIRSGSQSLQLSVRDYGIGVPMEHRPHLFERFYQAHADTLRSGLGLGLYISRAIVTQHGGEIAAEFPPEGGTRLVVTLPLSPLTSTSDAAADGRSAPLE